MIDRTRWTGTGLAFLSLLGVWGCPAPEAPEDEDPREPAEALPPEEARAAMIDSAGDSVGLLRFSPTGEGDIHVRGQITLPELADGNRGFHIHETGQCDPPDFESADGHYDPHGAPHGGPDDPPDERHAGDLGNVQFGPDGEAAIDVVATGLRLDEIVGLAVVVHEEEDDLTTDPTGDSGDRAACGVIRE